MRVAARRFVTRQKDFQFIKQRRLARDERFNSVLQIVFRDLRVLFQAAGVAVVDTSAIAHHEVVIEHDGVSYAYHASGHVMGTTRMGDAATNSVVNRGQRTWDHDNLWLAGPGNMPTIGSCNPTETAAAVSLLCADGVAKATA